MNDVAYRIVEHDGGWAYKLGDVFSETFPTRSYAEAAATRVAAEQRVPGETEAIEWQDADGMWHEEIESGSDRPAAYVEAVPRGRGRPDPARRAEPPALLPLFTALAIGALIAILARANRLRS